MKENKELSFQNAQEMRNYLRDNFEVGEVLKVSSSIDGYKFLWILLEDLKVQFIWDDFSVARFENGEYESSIFSLDDLEVEDTKWTIESLFY